MSLSEKQFEKASRVMPGGVNSSVRFSKARNTAVYMAKGEKGILYDLDGNRLVDMCCAHGAGLLGNAHPAIDAALDKAKAIGYLNSFETVYHEELASKVCNALPCADMVRFVGAGTEATMHLIRLCRAVTGKNKIIRMEGHFHGYHEMIYIGGQPPQSAFAENRKHPYRESDGIPEEFTKLIIPIPYNDREALDEAIRIHGDDVAVVILEPVNFNSGGMQPLPGYLEYVREATKRAGILLFFDEVQSSFKKSLGGAQADYGVTPDVCTIGKALGGGIPLSAFCGREDIMRNIRPLGNTQHSGTFNAHITSVMSGLAFMEEVNKPDFYPQLETLGKQLFDGIEGIIRDNDLNMVVPHYGARFNIVFGRRTAPERYEDTFTHKAEVMFQFIRETYARGVYFHDYNGGPSHHGYSIQHTEEDIATVLHVMEEVLKNMKRQGTV